MRITQQYINQLAYDIIGCAIEVHKHMGPGLLESIYEECLIYELRLKEFDVKSQIELPIVYKEKKLSKKLRLDILVNDLIIVELKAIETMIPLYEAQLLSHMKLTAQPKGLLINFNCLSITKEVVPLVNEHFAALPEK